MFYCVQCLYFIIIIIMDDGVCCLCILFQCQQVDLVSVSKFGFFIVDCMYINVLIDVVRIIFNNVVF